MVSAIAPAAFCTLTALQSRSPRISTASACTLFLYVASKSTVLTMRDGARSKNLASASTLVMPGVLSSRSGRGSPPGSPGVSTDSARSTLAP